MIRDIWGKLWDLSGAHANHRGLGPDGRGNQSPKAPDGVGLTLRAEINLYCLSKQIKPLEIYSRREFGSPLWRCKGRMQSYAEMMQDR